jgi:hypothetical protein
MKVGTRPQQGRTGEGRTGTKTREICPACQTYYLRTFFSSDVLEGKTKFVKKGKFCPNENLRFVEKVETSHLITHFIE